MNNIIDLLVIGGGPAGLMTAKTAAELGLKVTLIEKNKNFQQLRRACSAQFILDNGYEKEFIKLENGKILFTKNNFEVNYTGNLVQIKNKYYNSPKGHKIHFALPGQKAFAVKFDKRKLLDDLCNECVALGVDVRMSTLACGGSDKGDYVSINLKGTNTYTLNAKKVVIAEGANARLTGLFGLNKSRTNFATALVSKYILEDVYGIEPNSWNLFYGKTFFSNAPVIIGPSLYGNNTFELTISGSANAKPDSIYENVINYSPLKKNFENTKLIDKQGCAVKAFSSLKTPYSGNILIIGDSAAFVEVEVQGALMCGYHAANAIFKELKGKNGFETYTNWWKSAFEFNSDEYLLVSQGYALVPTYTDDELDYLFALIENKILEGTYSQYKTPKLIWDEILLHKDKIKSERPIIYEKIKKMNTMTLTDTFKN
ncbi:pyridine nucleotide-disulfide oxidoreductase domain protein [Clostridium bornimense]|uniref:Pyridine nucleotide-disulfide oxidoreductase domain protein n=1 Tax=Clostridium bornimense TaxID=1216932 RepID=W6RW79_9CLOT|nr:NAD(P)/FAD-dependent oxidoreductase [Clostridium bornimense]CDM68916.1 pyridine nucleotide-disulfide oxidoreductase domain protein [Clostridium bornimense]